MSESKIDKEETNAATASVDNDENDNDNVADEEDLEKLQAEIAKMEAEAERIAAETASLEQKDGEATAGSNGDKESSDKDARGGGADKSVDNLSIYVGQVDYSAKPEELLAHFEPCGQVERITINCDKFTGRPKGFAYLEFQTEDAVQNAVKLDGSSFKGRTLKVTRKRVNDPNYYYNQMNQGAEGGRGFGGRGFGGRGMGPPGGRGRGPPPGFGRGFGGRGPGGRGRGPPFRGGRGRGGYRGGFRGGRGGGGYGGGGGGGGGYAPHPYY